MAIEQVRKHLSQWNKQHSILEFSTSSATVDLAAAALSCEPARIAKSLSFKSPEGCILLVTAGDSKVDSSRFKAFFGVKAKMLTPEEVIDIIGHEVGGVCPFGVKKGVQVYTDISLQRFETVFPACGSSNSVIELTCDELFTYANSIQWVDVCKGWQQVPQ